MALELNTKSLHNKDNSPLETLENIRRIFRETGVSFREKSWHTFGNHCYSIRLASNGIYKDFFKTNGKGISIELALASAYAEMAERIQNSHIDFLYSRFYGLMPNEFRYPDEKYMDVDSIMAQSPEVLEHLINANSMVELNRRKVLCAPFFEVLTGEIYYLPIVIIKQVCGSNGMCAGNTPAEAITQGICEIFERYAIRRIFEENAQCPTISMESLRYCNSYHIIEEIKDAGFKVVIKDCSFGGEIPALAVMLHYPETGSYHVHFGSDTVLEVALERCLTELWQGYDIENFQEKMKEFEWSDKKFIQCRFNQWLERKDVAMSDFFRDGIAHMPDSFFISNGNPKLKDAFISKFKSNLDSLHHSVRLLCKKKKNIFIRDVGYLGFPAYQVYIPGYSELFNQVDSSHFLFNNIIRETLLKLKTSSKEDIRRCADLISYSYEKTPSRSFPEKYLSRLTGISVKKNSDFALFNNIDYLLAVLYTRVGDIKNAYKHLNEEIIKTTLNDKLSGLGNRSYFEGIRAYMRLENLGLSKDKIRSSVIDLVGKKIFTKIEKDLINYEDILDDFNLPNCGDCSQCDISRDCYYAEWKQFTARLSEQMKSNIRDQKSLSTFFEKMPNKKIAN